MMPSLGVVSMHRRMPGCGDLGRDLHHTVLFVRLAPSNLAGAWNVGSRGGPAWLGPASLNDFLIGARSRAVAQTAGNARRHCERSDAIQPRAGRRAEKASTSVRLRRAAGLSSVRASLGTAA